MANYGYLRVSTDQQDVLNQKHGVLEYANKNGFAGMEFIEDSVSGKKPWQERALGNVLLQAESGDTVIVSEVSRLARSTLQVLEILKHCSEHQINLHIAKNNMRFDDSMQSRITATVLGMAAEIEREFISSRTKEALAAKKAQGIKLGRPQGKAENLKLDVFKDEIQKYLDMGLSKASIAKLIECPATTLYDYCRVRKMVKQK
ncbi:recombinase family protein [Endozoicomonas sp. ISHI1]|uniref:recombinase family protein n=1 Tax=Endozoicomonas sp. ISHI1 TaxID=2825882 RepID=UPI0021488B8A|nr:recombinase family protein [Endozoicomonas sp. ISHI1]